jgi:hypothetical protein
MGAITGLVFAVHYRKIGLQREEYFDEEDEEDNPDEDRYWEVDSNENP